MQRLVEAVIALMQGSVTIAAFAGTYTKPGEVPQKGPFWGIAPEGTKPPYVVINQVPGLQLNRGFASGIYGAPCMLRFAVRDTSLKDVGDETETLARFFDSMNSITLETPEKCAKPLRAEEPLYMADPIENKGKRMYNGVLTYRFNVQRTIGS